MMAGMTVTENAIVYHWEDFLTSGLFLQLWNEDTTAYNISAG